jgi:hypothetical protein
MEQEKSSSNKKDPAARSQTWTWILMGTFTIIFIGAVVIFVGGWWLYKNKVDHSLEIAEEGQQYVEEESWLDDIDNYFIDDNELADISDKLAEEPNIINGTEKFVSNEYGFTLNFTENWSDYKAELIVDDILGENEYELEFDEGVMEADIEELNEGFIASYVFYYPSTTEDLFRSTVEGYAALFSLDIFWLDNYEAITKGDINEVGRNNRYIFTATNYYYPQQPSDMPAPEDISVEALQDINSVVENIETFDVRVLE